MRFIISGEQINVTHTKGRLGYVQRQAVMDAIKASPLGQAWAAEEQRKADIDKAWAEHRRAA